MMFIEDGNPNERDGLINWKKRQLQAGLLLELQMYQNTTYSHLIKDNPPLRKVLQDLENPNMDELYRLSIEYEPRQKE
jgi:hypothetical protein